MDNVKFIEEHKYCIGNLFVTFKKGSKTPEDYCVLWGGNNQFDDKTLFNELYNNVSSIQYAFQFVSHFKNNPFVEFDEECIRTKIMCVDKVIDFVNHTPLSDNLKLYLASMIFRCDIDNINYECPRLNGCVRHFLQVLMIFGYKFNLSNWQMPKLNNYSQSNIPQLINDIGYPKNKYQIDKQDFKNMYQVILLNLQQILLS